MMTWLSAHPAALVGLILWAAGVLWLMPGRVPSAPRPRVPGLLLAALGVIAVCCSAGVAQQRFADDLLFWLFGTGALLCGVLMITARNPVYAALWFALVTLCTCGLFLLRSAPFLAAATIIVYAGAVIVTFLFVIMLAQQSGAAGYDQKSRQAIPATLSAFVLLGAIVMTMQSAVDQAPEPTAASTAGAVAEAATPADPSAVSAETAPAVTEAAVASADTDSADTDVVGLAGTAPAATVPAGPNPLSQAEAERPLGSMQGLGRSLFGDYLFAVELAGTLLLIASVGAIAIAPRREQGAL